MPRSGIEPLIFSFRDNKLLRVRRITTVPTADETVKSLPTLGGGLLTALKAMWTITIYNVYTFKHENQSCRASSMPPQ